MFEKSTHNKILVYILLASTASAFYWMEIRPVLITKSCFESHKTNESGFRRCLLESGYPIKLETSF